MTEAEPQQLDRLLAALAALDLVIDQLQIAVDGLFAEKAEEARGQVYPSGVREASE